MTKNIRIPIGQDKVSKKTYKSVIPNINYSSTQIHLKNNNIYNKNKVLHKIDINKIITIIINNN